MKNDFLAKIRKLNWVLSESTTGSLSYKDLSEILCEIMTANIYVLDEEGMVLGVAYNEEKDSSAFEDEFGSVKVPKSDNESFMSLTSTRANLIGEELLEILSPGYSMMQKYHAFVPVICGGRRLGTVLTARYEEKFSDEEIALCEYGATVVGLEILRKEKLKEDEVQRLHLAVNMALRNLTFTERDAMKYILEELTENEGSIVTSKIAAAHGISNAMVVTTLRKMESAGLLECRSMGMKGTYIKIVNPYLKESIQQII